MYFFHCIKLKWKIKFSQLILLRKCYDKDIDNIRLIDISQKLYLLLLYKWYLSSLY